MLKKSIFKIISSVLIIFLLLVISLHINHILHQHNLNSDSLKDKKNEDDTYKYHELDEYVDELKKIEKDTKIDTYQDESVMIPEKMLSYASKERGGLVGFSSQVQGKVIKEKWMDANGNIQIDGISIEKTSEVVAVPVGTYALITIPDDSSWNEYIDSNASYDHKGVFLKDRKVLIDPFAIGQFEVTSEFYGCLMGYDRDRYDFQGPMCMNWYKACAFCNDLTKCTMDENECVYYNTKGNIYTLDDAYNHSEVVIEEQSYDTTKHKWIKKGYRLPTEAEWEFCARGGNPNVKDYSSNYVWNYAYAGVNCSDNIMTNINNEEYYLEDSNLEEYSWYNVNSEQEQQVVGLKKKNRLNLYDMSGNRFEWCFDWWSDNVEEADSEYMGKEFVENPLGPTTGTYKVLRGGSHNYPAFFCLVSERQLLYGFPDSEICGIELGEIYPSFRVCRSL